MVASSVANIIVATGAGIAVVAAIIHFFIVATSVATNIVATRVAIITSVATLVLASFFLPLTLKKLHRIYVNRYQKLCSSLFCCLCLPFFACFGKYKNTYCYQKWSQNQNNNFSAMIKCQNTPLIFIMKM